MNSAMATVLNGLSTVRVYLSCACGRWREGGAGTAAGEGARSGSGRPPGRATRGKQTGAEAVHRYGAWIAGRYPTGSGGL